MPTTWVSRRGIFCTSPTIRANPEAGATLGFAAIFALGAAHTFLTTNLLLHPDPSGSTRHCRHWRRVGMCKRRHGSWPNSSNAPWRNTIWWRFSLTARASPTSRSSSLWVSPSTARRSRWVSCRRRRKTSARMSSRTCPRVSSHGSVARWRRPTANRPTRVPRRHWTRSNRNWN